MQKIKNIACILLTAMVFLWPSLLMAQKKDSAAVSKVIKSYNEVISAKAQTDEGLFKVHQVDDRYYWEIPDSLFGRELMLVSRISKGVAEYGTHAKGFGFAGDQFGEGVVKFEKGPEQRIFLRQISFLERSGDSTENGLSRSVMNSNIQPIIGSYPIKAYSPDLKGIVIDVTELVKGDNEILYFTANDKKALSLGKLEADRSYVETVHSFPLNIEIRAVKTYLKAAVAGSTILASGAATYGLSASLVLLPKVPMEPRYFDPRVGYFTNDHIDYDVDPHGVKTVQLITRWHLEPKKEDIEKYKRGELVEPLKPIVIYIDPATPKKWVPYLIQGINDWQVAFEQAGFKNAITGREAPADDPEWSIEDARHSVIVYKPANIQNASGPHVHDPRSGEILETHINWYHNVMKLLHDWYFVQCAVVDPRARKMEFDDQLMGELIRFVSSHEVGHTLGLSHNFGSSSTVPVENLRNKKWVEENGHTPSIMDYARFNYVAQPEDSIGVKGLYPRIGVYDKWAIEWGYRWFPGLKTAEAEKPVLNKWVVERLKDNPFLWFADDRPGIGLASDPRVNAEILGDNVIESSEYGIKNLKRLKQHLIEWTKTPGEDYSNAGNMYGAMFTQLMTYNRNVAKYIGGIMKTNKTAEQSGPVYEFVPRARQKEAMAYLQRNLFSTGPDWLIDAKLQGLTSYGGEAAKISFLQVVSIDALFNKGVFDRLISFETERPGEAYTATEMLSDMKKGVWSELVSHKPIGIFRRNLQTNYTVWLTSLFKFSGRGTGASRFTDATAIIREHLRILAIDIRAAIPAIKDAPTQMHLRNILQILEAESVLPKVVFSSPN
jgi:hypothetical protein